MFMKSIPKASPNHQTMNAHTNDTASAGFVVRPVEQPDADRDLDQREQRVADGEVVLRLMSAPR